MKKTIVIAITILMNITCNNSNDDIPKEFLSDETIVYKSIAGIDKNLTSLDVYTLSGSQNLQPVVVWIHGGGWSIGDKLNKMSLKVPFFKSLNYVLVSINYRLSPFPYELNNDARIKYPDHIVDVADAVQWIYENIEYYGGDKTKIVILGHSAGAHLAALMGTNQSLLIDRNINSNHIKGVGSFDTQAYDVHRAIISLTESDLYLNAFSGDKTVQDIASPQMQIDKSIAIINHWLLVERGEEIRKDILNDFIIKLEFKSAIITKIDANVYTHAEVNDLIGDTSNTLMSDGIEIFLQTCFK